MIPVGSRKIFKKVLDPTAMWLYNVCMSIRRFEVCSEINTVSATAIARVRV